MFLFYLTDEKSEAQAGGWINDSVEKPRELVLAGAKFHLLQSNQWHCGAQLHFSTYLGKTSHLLII